MRCKPTVSVVIVNYQNFSDTIDFVEQMKLQKEINLNILIVDNHSPNNSFKILSDTFKTDITVEVIQSNNNKGYSSGNNFGFRYLKKRKVEFILISNNDIIIKDNLLISKMVESYLKCDNPAFLSPIMLNKNSERERLSSWKIPTFFDDIKNLLFLDRIRFFNSIYQEIVTQEVIGVDCLPGSFNLIRKDTLFDLGLFDENTFLYCEERIIAKRVKKIGLQNYLNANLSYIHKEGETIKKKFNYVARMRILVNSRIYFHLEYNKLPKLFTNLLWAAFFLNILIFYSIKPFRNER